MSQEHQSSRMAVLLFTDMVDSVALERRLGTESYSRLLKFHHQLFLKALAAVGTGKIHMDTGDGFLCEFSTAADSVNAALLFQMMLRESKWEKVRPQVRIGIHQGQLAEIRVDEESAGKIVGIPVSVASRVMSLAQAGQILMTRAVYDDARQFIREHPSAASFAATSPNLKWKAHGQYVFKGADDPIEIYEVGAAKFAPLSPPVDTEKGRRMGSPPPKPSRFRRDWVGAGVTVLCGLVLLGTSLGEGWVNASYDDLFRFGSRPVTNQVVIVFMDNEAYAAKGQSRDAPWDRGIHAELLNKLADDGCPLTVMDLRFVKPGDPKKDQALVAAMTRQQHLVLAANQSGTINPAAAAAAPILPSEPFLSAAQTNWGVAWLTPDPDLIVRRHWPFPSPGPYPSLPWRAAELAGAKLSATPAPRWIRYYGTATAWTELGYHQALGKGPGFYTKKIVFIGSKPETTLVDKEVDEFSAPDFRWTSETCGGVEILAACFLNLVNQEWLVRLSWPVETGLFLVSGILLGGGLCRMRWGLALAVAVGAALLITIGAVCLSYFSNYWFPWLIIVGGQLPCALVWALVPARQKQSEPQRSSSQPPPLIEAAEDPKPSPDKTIRLNLPEDPLPDAPEYELITPHIGKGGFGKVWIARNAIGQWQALKAVYQSNFGDHRGPYEAEFNGLQRYKPVSEKHPGLLRIDLVSRMKPEGYFYYVMELGDAQTPGWESQPQLYKPRDLENRRKQAPERRLPTTECLRIVTVLADALSFLHSQGLTHRDIKPSNVIFVNDRPKLADVGLVADIRPLEEVRTLVGTPGYMPPPPEKPGTVAADIYALGMVLYVISTGRDPGFFPDLATTLMERSGHAEFLQLNAIILKACQPDVAQRYRTTADMLSDLQRIK
jgi:CHASE2 domain-containing sensor protein/class 3 adenylate cyclase